ncbi:MAG: hypothetical protein ACK5JS_07120 [Mangrovibacterium sp.]
MKKIYFLVALLCYSYISYAQYFTTGADPASIKWKQIDEENFQVIYPSDYEAQAKRFAAMLEQVYQLGYQSLGTAPRKISVVLHSRTADSNGMVATAPSRMEIYPTPHQEMYAQEWLSQLAIHEYRHVVQTDKIQQELPKILRIILGEHATALTIGAYIPYWFLEGDAVLTETALTETGRGRNPSFLKENKALLLEQGQMSYDKISMGSYKDYIPNRYAFGWWFVGGIRKEYGVDVWENVLHRVARKPFSLSPVNKSLKESTGHKKEALYVSLWEQYQKDWQAEVDGLTLTNYEKIPVNKLKSYTDYLYTDHLFDGSIVALRKSRGDISRIVRLSNNREEIIDTPGSVVSGSFSSEGKWLIWNESRPDIRWTHANHTRTIVYNVETQEKKVFKSEDNLSSPAINQSKTKFLAVSASQQGEYGIQIFSFNDGHLLKTIEIPDNDYIISPAWGDNDDKIYFVGLGMEGKYLGAVDLLSGEISHLINTVHYDIRNLSYYQNQLIYTSAQTGIDNIFSYNLQTNQTTQLTESKFGADYAQLTSKHLDYTDYTSEGYKLVRSSISDLKHETHEVQCINVSNDLANKLASQEQGKIDFALLDTANIETKPYRKLPHVLNIHSWAPIAIDIQNYDIALPGVSFQSQNKLGTALTDLGCLYNLNEDKGKFYLNYQYIGWFPSLKLGMSYGGRNQTYLDGDFNSESFYQYVSEQWNELKLSASVSLPFKFSSGKYTQFIQPSIGYILTKTYAKEGLNSLYLIDYNVLDYQLYISNFLRRSELDLQTRWGQILQVNYANSLHNLNDLGQQFSVLTNLYFPGVTSHDGFKIYGGYQWRDEQRLSGFNDFVKMARGYASYNNKNMGTVSLNYLFPICYPDWSFGKLFYFQRIKANLFYDHTALNVESIAESFPTQYIKTTERLNSYGIEMYADGYFLRLPAPVTFGIRTMYLPNVKSVAAEFILSIDVYGI